MLNGLRRGAFRSAVRFTADPGSAAALASHPLGLRCDRFTMTSLPVLLLPVTNGHSDLRKLLPSRPCGGLGRMGITEK